MKDIFMEIYHIQKIQNSRGKKKASETPPENPWTKRYVNVLLLQKCLHPTAVIKVSFVRLYFRRHALWTKHLWLPLWQENDSPFIIFALVPHSIHSVFSLWYTTLRFEYTSFISLISDQRTCSAVSAHIIHKSRIWILKTILMHIIVEKEVTKSQVLCFSEFELIPRSFNIYFYDW